MLNAEAGPNERERRATIAQAFSVGRSEWNVRDDADFLNSICKIELPPANRDSPDAVAERVIGMALNEGFKHVRRLAEVRAYEARLNGSERRLWEAINRKTFGFSKLLEKIPHRFFTYGQIDRETGALQLDPMHGLPILPPTGIGKTHIKRGTDSLIRKRVITCVLADAHPVFGSQKVYSPLPIREAVRAMFEHAAELVQEKARAASPWDAPVIRERFQTLSDEVGERCGGLFDECNEVHREIISSRQGSV